MQEAQNVCWHWAICACRPVHHRIPNYKGADKAAARLAELEEFKQAQCVKVNPDTPQKRVSNSKECIRVFGTVPACLLTCPPAADPPIANMPGQLSHQAQPTSLWFLGCRCYFRCATLCYPRARHCSLPSPGCGRASSPLCTVTPSRLRNCWRPAPRQACRSECGNKPSEGLWFLWLAVASQEEATQAW